MFNTDFYVKKNHHRSVRNEKKIAAMQEEIQRLQEVVAYLLRTHHFGPVDVHDYESYREFQRIGSIFFEDINWEERGTAKEGTTPESG